MMRYVFGYNLEKEYQEFYDLIENLYNNKNTPQKLQDTKKPSLQNMMAKLEDDNKNTEATKQTSADTSQLDKTQNLAVSKNSKTHPLHERISPLKTLPTMTPVQLDKLERNLLTMDMIAMIRDQNICVVINDMAPKVVFTKKYISLAEINHSILPDCHIAGDKWLFQRLTQTFDTRLMQALIDYDSFPEDVLSINMNVTTILTKNFDKFIAKQKSVSSHPLILEITLFDIMSDLQKYYIAQKKLEHLGCKICICKMDIHSLYILNRELINVDFLKVLWNEDYLATLSIENKKNITEAISAQGKMRVVLSNCDSQAAIQFGSSLGIVMYQGYEIDKLQGF